MYAIANAIVRRNKIHIHEIIEGVRIVRNEIIHDFLFKKDHLEHYYALLFERELSIVKKQFIVLELSNLLNSPLDLVHYSAVLKDAIASNQIVNILSNHSSTFYHEIDSILNHYEY